MFYNCHCFDSRPAHFIDCPGSTADLSILYLCRPVLQCRLTMICNCWCSNEQHGNTEQSLLGPSPSGDSQAARWAEVVDGSSSAASSAASSPGQVCACYGQPVRVRMHGTVRAKSNAVFNALLGFSNNGLLLSYYRMCISVEEASASVVTTPSSERWMLDFDGTIIAGPGQGQP